MPLRYVDRRAVVKASALAFAGVLAPARAFAGPRTVRIAILGDSLSSGFGLVRDEGLAVRLQAALLAEDLDVEILDAGVAGDTTAGGLSRVDWVLNDSPDIVVVALGANDGLRGIDPEASYANLDAILNRIKEKGGIPFLAGMKAPRNLGDAYVEAFDGMYLRLATAHRIGLYPFLLEGVALVPDLNQPDGIHPNAEGVEVMVSGLAPALMPLVRRAADAKL